jgi:hypothetical protein
VKDDSCVVEPGEHKHLSEKSYANYLDAKCTTVTKRDLCLIKQTASPTSKQPCIIVDEKSVKEHRSEHFRYHGILKNKYRHLETSGHALIRPHASVSHVYLRKKGDRVGQPPTRQ